MGRRIETLVVALIALACCGPGGAAAADPPPAPGQAAPIKDWKKEFGEVCGKTQAAMQLETGELKALVKRCDDLMPVIEKLKESVRKVYGKRLAACRKLFVYVLESRQGR